MTGKDIDGTPILWTRDERDEANPVKPFPTHKTYLREVVKIFQNEQIILVDKCRQMMITTVAVLYAAHKIIFQEARRIIFSKNSEEEAVEVLNDKVRFPFRQMPLWFRELRTVPDVPKTRVLCEETGSYILAVGENVAEAEALGGTGSLVIVDEAARQPFELILGACLPMAHQVIAVTTAAYSLHGRFFYQLLEREEFSEL